MQENENREGEEYTRAGSVDNTTTWVHDIPTICTDVVSTDGIDDDDKGDKRRYTHQHTIGDNIDEKLFGENARFSVAWWTIFNVLGGGFYAETTVSQVMRGNTQTLEEHR